MADISDISYTVTVYTSNISCNSLLYYITESQILRQQFRNQHFKDSFFSLKNPISNSFIVSRAREPIECDIDNILTVVKCAGRS